MLLDRLTMITLATQASGNAKLRKLRKVAEQTGDQKDAETLRRNAQKIGGEYGFLRVTPHGYDMGKLRDPDGLLPAVFPDGK
jgi:hypothetical protein